MRLFLRIAAMGSFSKAEEGGYMAKQSMFRQISRLENEIGCELFVRSRTGVTLTEAGKKFQKGAKEILNQESELITACRRSSNTEFIRIGTVEHQVILNPVNELFARKYPEIELRRVVHPNHSGEYRVANRIMDVGETFIFDEPDSLNYEFLKLTEVSYSVAVGMNHPLAGHQKVSLKELSAYKTAYFSLMLRKQCRDELIAAFRSHPENLICRTDVDHQVEALYDYLQDGTAFLTANPFIQSVPDACLIRLDTDWIREYGIIYLKPVSATIQKYIDTAREYYNV